MKIILFIACLAACQASFGQSKKEQIRQLNETVRLLEEHNDSLVNQVSFLKEKMLELMKDQVEMERKKFMLEKETETLRKIMKGYVIQIDSLNTELRQARQGEIPKKSSGIRVKEPKNEDHPKEPVQSFDNPFGTGGSGNAGNVGNGYGSGSWGNTGVGKRKERVRFTNINIESLEIKEEATIYLKLTIDEMGRVIYVQNIRSKTTTTDQVLINKIMDAVKKQVRYSKDPGSPIVKQFYTIKVKPQ